MSLFNALMLPKLKKLYEKAVSGDGNAQFELADYYKKCDPEKAFKWFCYIANNGNPHQENRTPIVNPRKLRVAAFRELGDCYFKGKGTEKNYLLAIEAFYHLRSLDISTNSECQKYFVEIYKACQKELARSQDAAILYAAGRALESSAITLPGITTPDKRHQKMNEYYRKAAEMGHGDAIYRLVGYAFERLHSKIDYTYDDDELTGFLGKAAEYGSASAGCDMGNKYAFNDPDRAIRYYTMAAKNSAPDGSYYRYVALGKLGVLFLRIKRYDDALACYRELELWHPDPWYYAFHLDELSSELYAYEHRNDPIPPNKAALAKKTQSLLDMGKYYEEQLRNREDMRP